MTEAEWLACTDPQPMLEFLRGKVNERKSRLFAVGCCRRVGNLLADERSRQAIEHADLIADDFRLDLYKATLPAEEAVAAASTLAARKAARAVVCALAEGPIPIPCLGAFGAEGMPPEEVANYAVRTAKATADAAALAAPEDKRVRTADTERKGHADLIRDLLGNPFRSVTRDPTWQTATVLALAQAIYDDRAFDRMPILADALEEAGCTNADVLQHCRADQEHVRGCLVVDLLLAKD